MKWHLRILPNKEREQATQELKILEEEILTARDFLRKNRETFFQDKKKLPIYIILGPARFGKTTILSQSGLDLVDINKEHFTNVTPTKYCSFWFTKDAIYIDTAGNYTKPDISKPRNDMIWRGFIKLLQRYFGKNSISGILIILDLPTLSEDKNLLKRTLFSIRERVYELAMLLKNLHTHIIFTKCDRVLGFTEFFSLLDPAERQKPFGISFTNNKKADLISIFETKFNDLLQNLNNRIIENLQRSVRPNTRSLIKIFPSQLDHLRQTFIDVIGKIPNSNQIQLSGIYFTSSIQNGAPINPIKNTITNIFNLKEKPSYVLEANDNQSYFIADIFKNIINQQSKEKKKLKLNSSFLHREYTYALMIAILTIVFSGIIGYKSYHKNIAALMQTKYSLETRNIYNHNNLYRLMDQTKENSKSWWLTLGINKVKPLSRSIAKAHQTLFIRKITSELENYLNKSIELQNLNNNDDLYHGMQIYLMLNNYHKLAPSHIKTWFNNHWAKTYTNKKIDSLQKQLDIALKSKFEIETNEKLIDNIRSQLRNLPPIQLAYIIFENSYADQKIDIGNKTFISPIYTKENFHKIYDELIPNFANNIPKYNWILSDVELQLNDDDEDTVKNLQKIYVEKYIATWKNTFVLDTKIELKTLEETAGYLDKLSSANSSLFKFLEKIKQNTDIQNPPLVLTEKLGIELPGFKNIDPQELQNNFSQLASYITTIAKNSNPNEAAFTAVTKHLQKKDFNNPITNLHKFAKNQPAWLQKYLDTITTDTWQVLLNNTHNYVNKAWNQEVVPEYKKSLENRYPFFKTSKNDVTISNFSKFFGPQGTIDEFFKNYIQPLIDTDKTKWTWKKIDEQDINFSSNFLEVFLRAAMIQKMFFASKKPKPKLHFNLTPIAMTPHTQSFSLNIDGQKITFANKQQIKKTKRLVWPGPKPGSVITDFVNSSGKYFTSSEIGPWAWFRVLDRINVTPGKNTKRFLLTFDLNGNAAKYNLTTRAPVNPFIPDIINNFRCAKQPS